MTQKIAIVGDAMTDIDVHLELVKTMDGMPVYRDTMKTKRGGGAENVAVLCESLGADVFLFRSDLSEKRRTYFPDGSVIRIDNDGHSRPSPAMIRAWKLDIEFSDPDVILVCDHAKGVVTSEVMEMLKSLGKPIYVDPCAKSDWDLFNGVDCISANEEEWKTDFDNVALSVHVAVNRRGGDGVEWDIEEPHSRGHVESICTKPVDTVGAGDQFLAVLAVLRARGTDWPEAIRQANIAAGLQCERRGIVPVTWDEIDAFSKTLQETA